MQVANVGTRNLRTLALDHCRCVGMETIERSEREAAACGPPGHVSTVRIGAERRVQPARTQIKSYLGEESESVGDSKTPTTDSS